ncbi:adrenodoxin-type ferredoxin, putative [Plasmodium gallinaceum]|uniref:Adrenodoxin-type ferredoxin, putative n=1 Tax=Plasmodium gallinaceum TaxID=5849 RepID=A0A1J1H3N5_PLAGA|nr:adrenodoxin-type ferredoxin, putative [Plasmodium gallinaceum]CRG98095.1 adrenodoxin-type ferredoxin, putative [Plasmodium gallinaceum]
MENKIFTHIFNSACEGFCACSTCHVIIDEKFYDLLPEASDNEIDMLELAPCITETSRLGCQVKLKKELNGIKIKLPPMTRNFYVDGYVPTPH